MSRLSPESGSHWENLGSRVTHYDLGLAIRRNPDTGEMSTVAFDTDHVVEVPGSEAYFHPSITPGLESAVTEINPWDEALDAYNQLAPVEQPYAMRSFERVRASQGQIATPGFLLDAVARQVKYQARRAA